MYKQKLALLSTLFVVTLTGCKWNDDFRDRQQPQILEQPRRPTLNPDSVDYDADAAEQLEDEIVIPLPEIDTPIPEVQEYL